MVSVFFGFFFFFCCMQSPGVAVITPAALWGGVCASGAENQPSEAPPDIWGQQPDFQKAFGFQLFIKLEY